MRLLPWTTTILAAAALLAWALHGAMITGRIEGTWAQPVGQERQALTIGAGVAAAVWGAFYTAARVLRRRGAQGARGLGQLEAAVALILAVVFLAATFGEFSATLLSLGLVGFGLTLALQRPILALAGWATIFFGNMFAAGDRIQVADIQGDVLEVGLFTTRLWEVGDARSRSPGRPTGRIRTVSNAMFLEHGVANATSDTVTVFDEFEVTVAFESDAELARELLLAAATQVLEPGTHRRLAQRYQQLTRGLKMQERFPKEPLIITESRDSWVELRLRYLVDARDASRIRSKLTEAWLQRSAQHPDAILPLYPRRQNQVIDAHGRPA